jgi:hypothetical protein
MVAYIPKKQSGKYKAIASGAITNGKPVVVNANGTVSQIKESAEALGTEVVFDTNTVGHQAAVYDSNSERIVMFYQDQGNSNRGTTLVGTIDPSDNSISFGSPVLFDDAGSSTDMEAVFDAGTNRIVLVYRDNHPNEYHTAIVGSVDPSDNSIAFGTKIYYQSTNPPKLTIIGNNDGKVVVTSNRNAAGAYAGQCYVGTIDPSDNSISFGSTVNFSSVRTHGNVFGAFDSNLNKIVIGFDDGVGKVIVGTISGTGISFGTAVQFGTSDIRSIGFDSNSNKIVVTENHSSTGRARVGTVSGTGISFGTVATFKSGTVYSTAQTFNTAVNKMIICYDSSETDLEYVTATISGTDISFTTPVVYSLSNGSVPVACAYDSGTDRTFFGYRDRFNEDSGGPNRGSHRVLSTAVPTNITAENYIGIASGGTYASAAEATIDVVGTVNKDQTSLTAGQTYFVQADGTLGTSADTVSVVAGTAISATELIVKG